MSDRITETDPAKESNQKMKTSIQGLVMMGAALILYLMNAQSHLRDVMFILLVCGLIMLVVGLGKNEG